MKYRFKAIDASGAEVRDTIDAPNEGEAICKLRHQGLFATSVKTVRPPEPSEPRPPRQTPSDQLRAIQLGSMTGMG
jgi:type II secretory pathway component PulF